MGKTKYMQADEAFFKLIRLAVGTCHDCDVALDKEGWATVYEMACKQALAAVVLDGVERLSVMQKPPMEIVMPWIGLVQQIEVANQKLNRTAVMVCDKFRREGMGVILLKGQGNARLYPRPLHRTPGDIDLWMDNGRKAVVGYARKYCPGVEVCYHHVDFPVLKEAELELHFTPSWMNSWLMNRRLQRCFAEWKRLSLMHSVSLPGVVGEVAVPTAEMNRIYLLVHIYRHLFDEGIGLRQLLDYHFVLRRPCSEAERDEAVRVLKHLHLKRFASAVMYVLQTVFGLEDEYLLVEPSAARGARLLDEIMEAGNFGQYDGRIHRPQGEKPFGRFCRTVGRDLRFLADYPGEVIWAPLFKIWHYLWRSRHGYLPVRK